MGRVSVSGGKEQVMRGGKPRGREGMMIVHNNFVQGTYLPVRMCFW